MCLDVAFMYNNQENMKESNRSTQNSQKIASTSDFPIKCLCGGSLIDYPPVFDPKGE